MTNAEDLKEFILELRSILHEINSEAHSTCSFPSPWSRGGFQRIKELGKKIINHHEEK